MSEFNLRAFISESNHIEGIDSVGDNEEAAYTEFLECFGEDDDDDIKELEKLVSVIQPNAHLRSLPGFDVQVGTHIPPPGGPKIVEALNYVLDVMWESTPWETHLSYESLHPFTDGNGRSGRALWLYHMQYRELDWSLGFLHTFYYQVLSAVGPYRKDGPIDWGEYFNKYGRKYE